MAGPAGAATVSPMSSIRVLLACVPALGERVPREIADMPGPDDVAPLLLSLAGAPASH